MADKTKKDKSVRQFGAMLHVVGVLALICGVGAIHYMVCAPSLAAAARNRTEVIDLQRKVRKGRTIRLRYTKLKKGLESLQHRSEAVRKRVPDKPNKDEFLATLNKISDEAGVTIDRYSEGKRQSTKTSSYMLVNVEFSTGYVGFCKVLHQINNLKRIAFVEKLSMKEKKTGMYTFELTLVLYYGLGASEDEDA